MCLARGQRSRSDTPDASENERLQDRLTAI